MIGSKTDREVGDTMDEQFPTDNVRETLQKMRAAAQALLAGDAPVRQVVLLSFEYADSIIAAAEGAPIKFVQKSILPPLLSMQRTIQTAEASQVNIHLTQAASLQGLRGLILRVKYIVLQREQASRADLAAAAD